MTTKHIEQYSDPELARLAKDIVPHYNLAIEGELVDIDEEILGLFDGVEEVSKYYRRRILNCLYAIADILEYQEPEEKYRPMGFRGPWEDNQDNNQDNN